MSSDSVLDFSYSFCHQFKIPVPTELIEELIESGREIKFHDFVMLALLFTRDLRERKLLELDEELKADDEESTSEAADSEAEESDDDDDEAEAEKEQKPASPFKAPSLRQSLRQISSPLPQRIRGRLRAGSVRKDGMLQVSWGVKDVRLSVY